MKYQSIITEGNSVVFPEFVPERVYMEEFFKEEGLPSYLSKWQSTIDSMLDGVESNGPIYIMIDCAKVPKKKPHRRPGVHIDGYWIPSSGHLGNTHLPSRGGHGGGHRGSHMSGVNDWANATFEEPEALILASSVSAAMGYTGEFEGPIGDGGNCSHVDLSKLNSFRMNANKVYLGNVSCLHESIPVEEDCYRSLVRLNVKGWTPQ